MGKVWSACVPGRQRLEALDQGNPRPVCEWPHPLFDLAPHAMTSSSACTRTQSAFRHEHGEVDTVPDRYPCAFAFFSAGTRVWVGNGLGQIEALDMRAAPSKISMGHALKGSAGSVGARVLFISPWGPPAHAVSQTHCCRYVPTRWLGGRISFPLVQE